MSSYDQRRRQTDPLSRRLLSTYRINDCILQKFNTNGFNLKSEIECLSDSELKSICGMTDDELETIEKAVRKSREMNLKAESGLDLLDEVTEIIHTGCYSMNRFIGGGLQVGKITQVVAEAGTGKTQICMQCCVNVQLPLKNGGLSASALYIDTENTFRSDRLLQMAKYKLNTIPGLKDYMTLEIFKDNVHIFSCKSPDDLLNLVLDKAEIFIDQHPDIKLVVIDSIAHLFRYDYSGSNTQKDCQLSQIAIKLKEIAHMKNVAILITNQMRFNTLSNEDEATLGKKWQTYCNLSVILKKYHMLAKRQGLLVRTSEIQEPLHGHFYFEVTVSAIFRDLTSGNTILKQENGIKEGMEKSNWKPNYD